MKWEELQMSKEPLKGKIENVFIESKAEHGIDGFVLVEVKAAVEYLKELLGGECDKEIELAFPDLYKGVYNTTSK